MRLSEWRAAAPSKEAVAARVSAIVDPVLASYGVGDDPESWIAWGEEPSHRYTIIIPTAAGLVTCYVRVNVPTQGPRIAAKLIRWTRVQLGELAIETQGTHRLVSFQVEQLVLRGADADADRIAAFALDLYAVMDGRPAPARRSPPTKGRAGRGPGATKPAKGLVTAKRAVKSGPAKAASAPARRTAS